MSVSMSISVETAAISGRRMLRSALNTYTGHGEAPATLTNVEMIVLSSDRLNASSPPGQHGRHHQRQRDLAEPRERRGVEVGARLLERLVEPANRARTIRVTTAVEKMAWPIHRRRSP